jgi:serine/threonine protein kinase
MECAVLQVHQRLGEFEILRLLGKGGMGEVYEAQQDRPHRRVALKVLASWLAQDEEALKRFWREADVPAQLEHPGIVRIISTGQEEGIAYYTMQLVQGVTLAELIRQTRYGCAPTSPRVVAAEQTPSAGAALTTPHEEAAALPSGEQAPALCRAYLQDRYRTLARIGVMVARALAYAHGRGCVHRDLKPANIMIDRHDQAYVMDFGLTRALEPDGLHSALGTIAGTPWYMSPEQARGEALDHRSDIYSLGVTLYELATRGNGPYAGSREVREVVLTQVRTGQYLPLRTQVPDIPPALERIILKAMSYRPQRRYADAGEMAQDLERFLEQTPASRPRMDRPPRQWSKPILLGGALALVVLVALAAVFFSGGFGANRAPSDRRENAGAGAPGKAAQEQEDTGPPDYPEQFRKRMWGVPQALLTLDHAPVWHRKLAGNGLFARQRFQLMLTSPPPAQSPTLLALDDDPARRWFNFSVELNAPLEEPGKNRFGVFFGWRKDRARFFVVEIDEHPTPSCPHGRALISTLRIVEGGGAEMGMADLRWLPGSKQELPLRQSRAWHSLTVRALDDSILVMVDEKQPVPNSKQTCLFTMNWLAEKDPDTALALDLRGALGVWSWNGIFASFRNATVTALPPGEKGGEK